MEFLTIFLSSLLALVSPTGLAVEQVAADAIRGQLKAAEVLAVRVDNAPSYQIVQGRIERLRIAGRGLYPEQDIRVAALEIETDPIAVNPTALRQSRIALAQPLNAAVRLVLTREDINRALSASAVTQRLRNLSLDLAGTSGASLERYDIIQPQVEFLDDHRLRFQARLKSQQADTALAIVLETGIEIRSGRQLQLVDPAASINGRALPAQLVNLLVGGISQRLDLANLEESGITARILSWELDAKQISLAAFVQLDPQVLAAELSDQRSSSSLAATLKAPQ